MRVTKSFLRQIIKEELLRESVGLDPASFLKDDRIDLDFIENSGLWDDLAAGIEKLGMFILGHQKESLVKLMSLSLEECSLECPECTCEIGETGGISRLVQSGRSTFFCPRRQR